MIQRCTNRKLKCWPNYGGRGITVCKRWKVSFQAFRDDMGERPNGRTLDRIDNERGYSPANCRWATRTQQNQNQRKRLDNSSGIPGIHWGGSGWVVRKQRCGVRRYIGSFPTLELAKAARV
jgi:hypothetical protein